MRNILIVVNKVDHKYEVKIIDENNVSTTQKHSADAIYQVYCDNFNKPYLKTLKSRNKYFNDLSIKDFCKKYNYNGFKCPKYLR